MTGRCGQTAIRLVVLLGLCMVSAQGASSLGNKMGMPQETASKPEPVPVPKPQPVVATPDVPPEAPPVDEPLPPAAEVETTIPPAPPAPANDPPAASEPPAEEPEEEGVQPEAPSEPSVEAEEPVEEENAPVKQAESPPEPVVRAREAPPMSAPSSPIDKAAIKDQRARRSETLSKMSKGNKQETADLIKSRFEKAVPVQAGHESRPARPEVANPTDEVKERNTKLRADREAKMEQLTRQRDALNQNAAEARARLKERSDKVKADAMAKAEKKKQREEL